MGIFIPEYVTVNSSMPDNLRDNNSVQICQYVERNLIQRNNWPVISYLPPVFKSLFREAARLSKTTRIESVYGATCVGECLSLYS